MGIETILIWQTGENQKDVFRIDPSTNELVAGNSVDELRNILGDESNLVEWLEEGEVDFDVFWKWLDRLKAGSASSTKTCTVLLECWNFLEDLGETFGCDLKRLKSPRLKKIYSKLYYGNNLPSVTPEGKTYNPIWEHEEVEEFKKEMKLIWKLFLESGYIRYQPGRVSQVAR